MEPVLPVAEAVEAIQQLDASWSRRPHQYNIERRLLPALESAVEDGACAPCPTFHRSHSGQKRTRRTPRSIESSSPRRQSLSSIGNDRPSPFCRDRSLWESDEYIIRQSPQPRERPVSQEQLVSEVKGIYAGLVLIESKCIAAQNSIEWAPAAPLGPKLPDERIALLVSHLSRLREHGGGIWKLHQDRIRKLESNYTASVLLQECPGDGSNGLRRSRHQAHLANIWGDLTRLSGSMVAVLYEVGSLPGYLDNELLWFLDKTSALLDRLFLWFQKICFEPLVYLLLFFCAYFEFPNGMRHICTTMPWTIWPALVVLWGVCWMFPVTPGATESTRRSTSSEAPPLDLPVENGNDLCQSSHLAYP